jgi:hypothetical protein
MRSRTFEVIPETLRLVAPRKTEDLRRCLASNLIKITSTKLNQPNLLFISRTVEILDSLLEADRPRFQKIYVHDFNNFHVALEQWVEPLKLLLEFHDVTKFQGDLTNRTAFLQSLSSTEPLLIALGVLDKGSSSLSRWLNHEDIAKKVVSMLSNLFLPQSWWTSDTIEALVLEFTKKLTEWFK